MTQSPTWDRRSVPATAISLIRRVEGVRLVAYQDSVRVWTIGVGSAHMPSGRPVRAGDRITDADASNLLTAQCEQWVRDIVASISAALTEAQASAVISFVHNLGGGALSGSTLARMANGGDMLAAGHQFNGWAVAGGQVALGLLRRREYERRVFAGEAAEGQAAYAAVWAMQMHDLLPFYERAFDEARAWGWQASQAAVTAHAGGGALGKPVPVASPAQSRDKTADELMADELSTLQQGV